MKNIFSTLIKVSIAALIIYWLSTQGKFNLTSLKEFLRFDFLIPAIIIGALNTFIISERWRILLSTQGLHPKSWELLKLTFIGTFFNFAMPGGVGGDIIKAFYFYKDHPNSKAIAVSSVFIDRLLGLYTIISMALFVMLIDINHVLKIESLRNLFMIFIVIYLGFNAGLFFIFSKNKKIQNIVSYILNRLPLKEKLFKLYQSGQQYGSEKSILFKVFLMSILAQSSAVFLMYLTGKFSSFGQDVPLMTYFLVTPIGFMATAIPISPAGVGVGQAAFYYLFNVYLEHESQLGPIVITVFQMVSLVFGLIGAVFYLQRRDKKQELNQLDFK